MGRGQRPKEWGCAWAGGASRDATSVEVPSAVAAAAGITDGARCAVRAVGCPPAQSVVVEPASADDWEVLEQNADYVEGQLLQQVGVVVEGQPFPVWIRGQSVLTLRPVSVVPGPMAQLTAGSEVAIAPRTRQQDAKGESVRASARSALCCGARAACDVQCVPCARVRALAGASTGWVPASTRTSPCARVSAPPRPRPRAPHDPLLRRPASRVTTYFRSTAGGSCSPSKRPAGGSWCAPLGARASPLRSP